MNYTWNFYLLLWKQIVTQYKFEAKGVLEFSIWNVKTLKVNLKLFCPNSIAKRILMMLQVKEKVDRQADTNDATS